MITIEDLKKLDPTKRKLLEDIVGYCNLHDCIPEDVYTDIGLSNANWLAEFGYLIKDPKGFKANRAEYDDDVILYFDEGIIPAGL